MIRSTRWLRRSIGSAGASGTRCGRGISEGLLQTYPRCVTAEGDYSGKVRLLLYALGSHVDASQEKRSPALGVALTPRRSRSRLQKSRSAGCSPGEPRDLAPAQIEAIRRFFDL